MNSVNFAEFLDGVKSLLEETAAEKGYNAAGTQDNHLFAFTSEFFAGHASGEVVYKLVRYSQKHNKEDLLKAAAWLYLIWRYDA